MSSDGTGTPFAAAAAAALRRELGTPRWAGRRLLLRQLHGLSAAAVFSALFDGAAKAEVDIYPDGPEGEPVKITAIVSDGGTDIIPYLVDSGAATANSGQDGFAATLRTHFLERSPRPRALIILAAQPQETIESTTQDAATLSAVSFARLCWASALPADHEAQPPRLIREVAGDYIERLEVSQAADWRYAERLRVWVDDHREDTDAAIGAAAHQLGPYVADPELRPATAARRLRQSAAWRANLDDWMSSPSQDLARRLAARRVGSVGMDAVLAARTVRGLDYSRFHLADLQARGARPPVRLDEISPVSGATIALISGDSIAVWLPRAGGTLEFKLTRALERNERARLRWQSAPAAIIPTRATVATASVAAPEEGGWRFGLLELLEGDSPTARYPVAAAFHNGDLVAFEDAIEVDPERGGFTCGETPRLSVWHRDGRALGAAQLDPAEETGATDTIQLVTGTFQGVPVGPVPVIPSRAASDGDDADADPGDGVGTDTDVVTGGDVDSGIDSPGDSAPGAGEGGDGDGSDEDLADGQGTGRGDMPGALPEQPTLAHAMLAYRRNQWPDKPSASHDATEVTARFDAVRLSVRPRVDGTDLLPAERAILKHPEWCMFAVDGAASTPLREFPRPERAWSAELEQFRGARARYFDAALAAGSTYALDPRSQVARDYTLAYRRLLDALPRDATSRTEYDDILLVDRAEVRGIADMLVAPTSPLTVAWHAALADRFAALAADDAELDRADISSFTPQYLIPLLMNAGDWHEMRPSPTALLWRRYAPLAASSPGALERNAAFIASRIAFFLSVHPSLNRPETTLAVTFADPDDGEAAIGALRQFFRHDRTSPMYRRPRIRAVLTGAGRPARRSINALLSGAADNDLDRIVRTRSDLVVAEDPDPPGFSSISFLFRSPGGRSVRPVRLDQRAPTSYGGALATTVGRVLVPDAEYVFATGTFCAAPGEDATDVEAIQYRSLELVGGQGGERLEQGWTRMVAATASESELARWYDRSGWVVHLDRLVGLEAFADAQAARTLLEYEEGADPAAFGYDGITGTRYVEPYLAAMRRALAGVAAPDGDDARALMRLLEGVSGRWALQIVQRPILKVLERAGTACAIRYLVDIERTLEASSDAFSALVALEEIVPGFPEAGIPRRFISSRAGRGPMCDDLLLLSVQPRGDEPPLVQATVVEVKFWQAGGADYSSAADQVEETITWLGERFCDIGALADLRGRDFAELIRSARMRNSSFGLAPALSPGAEDALGRISSGEYELAFGHWRRDSYRRGLVVAVEHRQAGNLQLSQLNAVRGPIDLVSIREDVAVQALEMRQLAPPRGWARLATTPPGTGSGGRAAPPARPGDGGGGGGGGGVPVSAELDEEVARDARRLNEAFAKYGLTVEPFDPTLAQTGPSVIRFRTRVIGRLSITEIERRSRDISREVGAPGGVGIGDEPGFITVDVPRAARQTITLSVALQALDADKPKPGALSFVAGVAPSGEVRIADLSRLPHLLVSGATGSGKSVFLRGMLVELLRTRSSEQLRLMIIDPKRLDFAPFTRVPHLERGEIISDPGEALERLRSTLEKEIDRRQPILADAGVSSAAEFYEAGGPIERLPQLVIMVDEFADLVLAGPDRRGFSEMVQRYAQLTRAYGIFLVLATQRPSVDVITGSIKANLSARIAFSLPSARDSMTILDRGGAEDLLGDGDLLFYRNGKIERLQAPLTTLADVRAVLDATGLWR